MKRTLEIAVFIVIAALVLSACPKKPAKPVLVPPKTEVEPEKEAEEPSIRGGEFRSVPEIKNVYFDYDKYTITEESKKTLESDAEYLKKDTNLEILVEGNTCECGTNEYNLGLAQKRASAVREYLINLGVDGARIATIAFGEENCINKNAGPPDTPACKLNRRAEIKIRGKAAPAAVPATEPAVKP